jgi:protein O-mannosyl-transferase
MKRRRQSKSTGNAEAGSAAWTIRASAGLIALAAIVAYSNSLRCAFVFDDIPDILDNASIRHLWPIWDVFIVPSAGRVALHGRPVANFLLALNYAAAGFEPFGYHLINLFVHLLAGLTLFGIVRRTLVLPSLGQRFAAVATPLALATALLWILHPLNTAAVTYVIQRYESMMGLFYLAALYSAIRCATSPHPRRWAVAAATTALLGMGCKEVAVSIPLSILLYDRAFLAGSFREALRRRRGMYVGLACAWAGFALLFAFSYSRGSWAGYGLPTSWTEYGRSQFGVILHYLRLSFWPCPLVLDYDWPVAHTMGQILPGAVAVGGLAAATVYSLIRWPKWGFLGASFFLILTPTSSVMPLSDLAVEYRMYLPLAVVMTGAVLVGYLAGGWLVGRRIISPVRLRAMGCVLVMAASVALGVLTYQRNGDYRSDLAMWQDTVAKAPENDRAHNNLGNALADRGRVDEALAEYEKSLELNPDYAEAHNNLGTVLMERKRLDEAIAHFSSAVEIMPEFVPARYNLAVALNDRGRVGEAIAEYRKVLEIKPDFAEAREALDQALADKKQGGEFVNAKMRGDEGDTSRRKLPSAPAVMPIRP